MFHNQSSKTEEEKEKIIKQAQLLDEMVKSEGWSQVVVPMLEARMHHAWIDPREDNMDMEKFAYAELNLFYARDAAKQLLEDIYDVIEEGFAYRDELTNEELNDNRIGK